MLVKLTEGKIFAEVLNEICYKIKPEDSRAEVSFIQKKRVVECS